MFDDRNTLGITIRIFVLMKSLWNLTRSGEPFLLTGILWNLDPLKSGNNRTIRSNGED